MSNTVLGTLKCVMTRRFADEMRDLRRAAQTAHVSMVSGRASPDPLGCSLSAGYTAVYRFYWRNAVGIKEVSIRRYAQQSG